MRFIFLCSLLEKAGSCHLKIIQGRYNRRCKMKRYFSGISGPIIIAILAIFIYSNLCATEEELPTPEQIIEKNIQATGGKEAYEKIKNRKAEMTGRVIRFGIEAKAVYYQERPNKFYSLTDLGAGGEERSGSDGKIAWVISPFSGPRVLEGEELTNKLLDNSFNGADGYDTPYKMMKTEGIEEIDGKTCYKVVKTPEKGSPRITYYDKDSFLIVKTATELITPQGTINEETYYEGSLKVNDISFPQKITTFITGKKYNEIVFDKIELNIEMPEGIFDTPEEIKAIMR
jgi:hypothetical protein